MSLTLVLKLRNVHKLLVNLTSKPLLLSLLLKQIRKFLRGTNNPKTSGWSLTNCQPKSKNTENNMMPTRKCGSQKLNPFFRAVQSSFSSKELHKIQNVDLQELYSKFSRTTALSSPFTILSTTNTWDTGSEHTKIGQPIPNFSSMENSWEDWTW